MDVIDRHLATIRRLALPGGPLAADGPRPSLANPEWFEPASSALRQALPGRARLHTRLIEARWEAATGTPRERRCVIVTGLPGAGKSTFRASLTVGRERFVVVDADEFKSDLLREAVRDHSLDSWFTAPEVRMAIEAGEVFSPLDYAPLVHRESALLARRLRDEAIEEGVNLILDTVMADPRGIKPLSRKLTRAGYQVEVIDVEAGRETIRQRIEGRWRAAHADHLAGRNVLGSRWVPSHYASQLFTPDGASLTQQTATLLAAACPAVMRLRRYRTDGPGGMHTPETDLSRLTPGGPLLPPEHLPGCAGAEQPSPEPPAPPAL